MSSTHPHQIHISTLVKADVKTVWNIWNAPEHICHWNFASDDWHCPKAKNDLKKGGGFSYVMASKDGKMSFDFQGVYTLVKDLEQIDYVMADGRKVSVQFEVVGDQVNVSESFDPEQENSIELQKNGWQAILDNFKKRVESLS